MSAEPYEISLAAKDCAQIVSGNGLYEPVASQTRSIVAKEIQHAIDAATAQLRKERDLSRDAFAGALGAISESADRNLKQAKHLDAATCEVFALRAFIDHAFSSIPELQYFNNAQEVLNRTAADYAHLVAVPREEWEALELARDCLGELAKLVTNDDGIDPEAFHIELTREQAYQIKMADENRAAMAADK